MKLLLTHRLIKGLNPLLACREVSALLDAIELTGDEVIIPDHCIDAMKNISQLLIIVMEEKASSLESRDYQAVPSSSGTYQSRQSNDVCIEAGWI